ncbi:MAG TPA: electron transfer flavoprotein subunit beta/FixA family protein [Longimicrobiales bacterium]
MDIIVCIKRTPDTETRIRIADDGKSVDPSGVKYIVSPYDEYAVEAALRMKEAAGEGEVAVMTLGDAAAAEQLRASLAMGADRAVLLLGDAGTDGLSTAKALAAELEGAPADLVLFGVKAADDDQQQVGPMVATLLGRPCVTSVATFELEGGKAVCHREVEGGAEIVEVDLPAVVTVTKGAFDPRYASLKGIMAAKRKPLEEKEVQVAPARLRVDALEYPPERPEGRVVGEGTDAVPELVRLLREEAKAL